MLPIPPVTGTSIPTIDSHHKFGWRLRRLVDDAGLGKTTTCHFALKAAEEKLLHAKRPKRPFYVNPLEEKRWWMLVTYNLKFSQTYTNFTNHHKSDIYLYTDLPFVLCFKSPYSAIALWDPNPPFFLGAILTKPKWHWWISPNSGFSTKNNCENGWWFATAASDFMFFYST